MHFSKFTFDVPAEIAVLGGTRSCWMTRLPHLIESAISQHLRIYFSGRITALLRKTHQNISQRSESAQENGSHFNRKQLSP